LEPYKNIVLGPSNKTENKQSTTKSTVQGGNQDPEEPGRVIFPQHLSIQGAEFWHCCLFWAAIVHCDYAAEIIWQILPFKAEVTF
jgi:hypothetical protein